MKTGLAADDIAGIRSIYSGGLPRSKDFFGGQNSTISTANDVTSVLSLLTNTEVVPNLDIATAGQAEFFTVTAPLLTSGTMQVSAQSLGLSLLSPKLTVFAANQLTVLGSASAAGQYGANASVTISNVTPFQKYYIEVQGADTTAFGTGNYALGVSFNGSAPPTEASPVVVYPNGATLHAGGGQANDPETDGGDAFLGLAPVILNISPDTGASASDGVTSANQIVLSGIAPANETITMYNGGLLIGTTTSNSTGNWSFNNTGTTLATGIYNFTATATDPSGNVSTLSNLFQVTVDTSASGADDRRRDRLLPGER